MNKKTSLQESIQKLNDQILMAKEEGNTVLIKNLLRILERLKEKKTN